LIAGRIGGHRDLSIAGGFAGREIQADFESDGVDSKTLLRPMVWNRPDLSFVCPNCKGRGEYVGLMERRTVRWLWGHSGLTWLRRTVIPDYPATARRMAANLPGPIKAGRITAGALGHGAAANPIDENRREIPR